MSVLGTLLRPVFEVTPTDVPVLTSGDGPTTERLSKVVFTVTECCELTLMTRRDKLVAKLDAYPEELLGFAYEGAGIALAALDDVLRWKQRTRSFVDGPARDYIFAVYLGAGMGLARLHRNPEPFRRRLDDPVMGWAVLDGYGFHEGFFAYRRHVQERATPRHLSGYGLRVFDHGLGRGLWFATGADAKRVHATIDGFPPYRQGDLWAGIGLGCGYTGGVDEQSLETLRALAGRHLSRLAEGVVVAARARHQVGNPGDTVELASRVICGLSSQEAAEIARNALDDLPDDDIEPAYELWRQRIRSQFPNPSQGDQT
ncbi:DUF1702 family protein [Kribbella sp. NPDC056951]|uniref:DUF1702 family protein n=1 Tax=Kribbella sp. NPDC056951 TaxID=3345978 RepID=UPI003631E14F